MENAMRMEKATAWQPWPLGVWLVVALGAASTGALVRLPVPVVPLVILGSVAGWTLVYRRHRGMQAWVGALDLRWPLGYQLIRLVYGWLFLQEMAAGRLPPSFAITAGYGDIAAGLMAAVGVALLTARARAARPWLWAFSVVGLVDMVTVVLTAMRLLMLERDPLMRGAFEQTQYGVLPLFVVPMVFLTHGAVVSRLRGRAQVS